MSYYLIFFYIRHLVYFHECVQNHLLFYQLLKI